MGLSRDCHWRSYGVSGRRSTAGKFGHLYVLEISREIVNTIAFIAPIKSERLNGGKKEYAVCRRDSPPGYPRLQSLGFKSREAAQELCTKRAEVTDTTI